MFCTNCGKQIPDDSMFCPECGAKVIVPQAPQTPEMPPAPEAPQAPQNTAVPGYPTNSYEPGYAQPDPNGMNYNPPGYGVPTRVESPAGDIVRKYVGGGAFLTMTICLTIVMLMSFVQTASFFDLIRYSFYDSAERAVVISTLMFTFIMMLLLLIGTWMMWGTARSRISGIKGTGLVKAWAIICAVLIGIVLLTFFYYAAIEAPRQFRPYIDELKRIGFDEYMKEVLNNEDMILALVAITLSFLLTVFYFIYFIKIAIAAGRIREMSWYGAGQKKIPGFINVMNVFNIIVLLGCIFFLLFAAEELQAEIGIGYYYNGMDPDGFFTIGIISLIICIVVFVCFIVVNSSINGALRRLRWAESEPQNGPPAEYY